MELKRYKDFMINESKVASAESPLGYYLACNALMPTELFALLDEKGIKYQHDGYANFIEVFVENLEDASFVRDKVLDMDVYDADDIEEDDLPSIEEDGPGDMLEIKLKQ